MRSILILCVVGFALAPFGHAQEEPTRKKIQRKIDPQTEAMSHVVVAAPANCAVATQSPQLGLLPDGTVVVTRPDGNQENVSASKMSVPQGAPRPGGTDCGKCDDAASNRPPALPDVNNWLNGHAQNLLDAIQSIVGTDQVNNELQWERGGDIYGVIAKRTETLRRLALYVRQ
jgi:hypothetical protein